MSRMTRRLDVVDETVGPRHDPYSRTTYVLKTGDKTVRLVDCSLAMREWVEVVVGEAEWQIDGNPREAFLEHTGLTVRQFQKAHERIHGCPSRCGRCGSRLAIGSGYVGEDVAYCPKSECGAGVVWTEKVTRAMIA